MRGLLHQRLITKLALVVAFLLVTAPLIVVSVDAQPAPPHPAPASSSPEGMYAYYYLWWDTQHWQTTLGSNYPFGQSPLPLPATLDAGGCNPTSLYGGNIETDAPATLFTQDDPSQVTYDVQSAIAAGLTGFAVDWYGTGSAAQSPSSSGEDQRLDLLVQAVDQAQAEGHNFHLWLSYEASSTSLTQGAIAGDLSYLTSQYGNNPAFDRSNGGKPTFIWVGSYKYPLPVVATISGQFRSAWYFVGGYQWNQWSAAVAPYFDADSPYWSSQDPWHNSQSFQQLDGLAATLHAEGKKYFAPLSPGFDRQLDGSATCIPRDDGATLQANFDGNATAGPDGWLLISWNEITEGTYVTPELQRYGGAYGGPYGFVHDLVTGSGASVGRVGSGLRGGQQPGPSGYLRGHRRHLGTGRMSRVLVGRRLRPGPLVRRRSCLRVPDHGDQRPHRGDHRHPRSSGLLAPRSRRGSVQLRGRPVLRFDRRHPPQRPGDRHDQHPGRWRLLPGGPGRRCVLLR